MPTEVWTANDLNNVRNNLAGDYIQMAHIDLGSWGNWTPIGHGSGWGYSEFLGSYAGNGHKIIDMSSVFASHNYIGLFAYLGNGSEVSGLGFVNATVEGDYLSGALAGASEGTVSQCESGGSIKSNSWYAGGLIGAAWYNGSIANCYNKASVDSPNATGGLIGFFDAPVTITNCYSAGLVVGAGLSEPVGGLVGHTYDGVVTNSYYDSDVSGQSDTGKGEPRTTAEMTHPSASNTYVSWDFATIWKHDTDYTINAGYPYLFAVEPAFAVYAKIAAAWKSGPAWIKKDGTWKSVTDGWIKEGGVWKPIIP